MIVTHKSFLLFAEPFSRPTKEPILDIYTQKMTGALRYAETGTANYRQSADYLETTPIFAPRNAWRGMHWCRCGAIGGNRDCLIETLENVTVNRDGQIVQAVITNALCVHYLAYHRDEIPQSELDRILLLKADPAMPDENELQSPLKVKL